MGDTTETMNKIEEIITYNLDITLEDIKAKKRGEELQMGRQLLYYFMKESGMTATAVGEQYDVGSTAVFAAMRAVVKGCKNSPRYREVYKTIKQKIDETND